MLTGQAQRLRTVADQMDKVLSGKYDAINPSTISPLLRDAADTIEDLRNRLTETCELEINTDMTAVKCSRCGYVVPKGTNLMNVKYCAGCGRKVV